MDKQKVIQYLEDGYYTSARNELGQGHAYTGDLVFVLHKMFGNAGYMGGYIGHLSQAAAAHAIQLVREIEE